MTSLSEPTIGELTERPETWNPAQCSANEPFVYIDIASIDNVRKDVVGGSQVYPRQAPSRARQKLRAGDILVSTVRPSLNAIAEVPRELDGATGSTGFSVLRPKSGKLDGRFLYYWVQNPDFVRYLLSRTTGANYPAVSDAVVRSAPIPALDFNEQRRIAAILDKADAIRRKREQSLALADNLLKSAFLDMFGHPVSNPRRLRRKYLAECADFISGATPSKANSDFWEGTFPWVSPKDMKIDTIWDAQDHVSDSVFQSTNLKKIPAGTPLIVVRGMILVHTVPLAMTGREVAINQDIKAIQFDGEVNSTFGFWCLKAQHSEILGRVSTAAHGTKRLDMADLGSVPILLPDANEQLRYSKIVERFNAMRMRVARSVAESKMQFASLSQRAFRGEL